jgi:hypothetical protein
VCRYFNVIFAHSVHYAGELPALRAGAGCALETDLAELSRRRDPAGEHYGHIEKMAEAVAEGAREACPPPGLGMGTEASWCCSATSALQTFHAQFPKPA